MKNEAAFGYEACLRHTERKECALLFKMKRGAGISGQFYIPKICLNFSIIVSGWTGCRVKRDR